MSCSDQSILRILGQDETAPLHLLSHLIGMLLQSDRTLLTKFRVRIGPIGDQVPIDHMPDPMADREDLHPIPIMLISNSLGETQSVLEDTVAAEQIVVAIICRIHH